MNGRLQPDNFPISWMGYLHNCARWMGIGHRKCLNVQLHDEGEKSPNVLRTKTWSKWCSLSLSLSVTRLRPLRQQSAPPKMAALPFGLSGALEWHRNHYWRSNELQYFWKEAGVDQLNGLPCNLVFQNIEDKLVQLRQAVFFIHDKHNL